MTHKRLKNYLKFGILFFIISLLNLGCQKDESLEPNEQVQEQNPFTINHINSNQISNNTKLALSLERLNAAKTKSNTENRTAHSEEHNFYIDTERAVYIESQDGSYHSYTFLVQRNDEQTGLENLLLSLQEDGSYTAKLIKYDFEFYGTDGFLEALSNNHNNVHITPIDADELTASLFARTTTSGVCFFITETSCSYGNHSGGYYANGNQCPGHHSHTRMECLGGGGQSGNSGTGDGSATTGSGETDSTTGGSGSTNGGTLGGNNNNDFTLPLTLSMAEQLSSFIDLTLEQEVWANKPQNEDNVQEIINYMLAGGDAEFASEATDAFMDNGEVDFDEKIINELDGKALCVYNKLKSSSTGFKNAIKKFDGEFTIADIKFVLDDNGDTVKVKDEFGNVIGYDRAHTSIPDANNLIIISLNNVQNSNNNVNTQPNLLLAQTIAHEVIHAEMFRQILNATENGSIIGLNNQDVLDALASSEYTLLYEYFRQHQNWSHTYMAEHFRDVIARMTQEFDTGISVPDNQQPDQLYLDLAWRGLMNNVAWDNEGQNQIAIENTIDNYVTNNSNETCID